jgi:hypothetical protein
MTYGIKAAMGWRMNPITTRYNFVFIFREPGILY